MKLFGNSKRAGRRAAGDRKGLSVPAIAGIAVGGVLLLTLVVVLFFRSQFEEPDIPVLPDVPVEQDGDIYAYHTPEFIAEDAEVGGFGIAPEGFTNEDRRQDVYTLLVVGLDEKGYNTDTIMVLSYNSTLKQTHLVSIPRDSKVNVKRTQKRINQAYGAGSTNGGGVEGGIAQLQRELKTIIGFIPDKYIIVNLNAFVQIVDAVGGVTVDVPFDMVLDDNAQDLHINIPKGQDVLLNGEEALKFARYRKGKYKIISDYERIENQQAVLKSLSKSMLRQETLTKIDEFVDIFNNNVQTDLKLDNIKWYALQLTLESGSDSLFMHTLPTSGTSGAPDWYEYLDEAAVLEMVNSTINPYTKDIEADDLDIIVS